MACYHPVYAGTFINNTRWTREHRLLYFPRFISRLVSGLTLVKGIIKNKLGTRIPLVLIHMVTMRCNSRCEYCFYWRAERNGPGNGKEDEIDTKTAKRVITEARRLGIYGYAVTGGEPLVKDDVVELLDHAKAIGLRTSLVTNGLCPTEGLEAAAAKLDLLSISLDTLDRERYKRLRGIDGLERAMASVELMARWCKDGPLYGNINAVLTNENKGEVNALVSHAAGLGIGITFEPMCPNPKVPDRLLLDGDELKEVARELQRLKATDKGRSIWMSKRYLRSMVEGPDFGGKGNPCLPELVVRLDPRGNVTAPCFEISASEVVGNVRSSPLGEIIGSERMRKLSDHGRDCPNKGRCWILCYTEPSMVVRNVMTTGLEAFGRFRR